MANIKYLRCAKCGNAAKPTKTEVGTSTLMRCRDCGDPNNKQYATMCRQCCPSNHGTYMYQEFPEVW